MINERNCTHCGGAGTSNGLSDCGWCEGSGTTVDSEHRMERGNLVSFDGTVRVTGLKLRELAEVAYLGYHGSKSPEKSVRCHFEDLSEEDRTAWVWAVDAMLGRVLTDLDGRG